ncbi:hypothetical protein [Streptomyces peucetius]|uniref:SMI1/KNR4 family protein n=1 Tax=Streptomyces peucetius TaxID=1950 RepID=A0ABY6IGK5_STRPE|nr:hypothetical protein [Streptomyces peucetius]UYQ66148.1 hypothetical protein OGH68_34960 [Streptomyces peucetius]
MPPQQQSAGPTDGQLSVIDRLSSLPFPEEKGRAGSDGQWGGPGFHLAVLRESRDFWEDRSTEIVEAAEEELEADLAALAVVLTKRWGAPETVDLWPYLGFDDPGPHVATREPLSFLCNVAGSMRMWRLPNSERWFGLAIGQADPEWQFQLLAAVGETSSLTR